MSIRSFSGSAAEQSVSISIARASAVVVFLSLLVALLAAAPISAQTTLPFVFSGATLNGGPAIAVFTRDDTTGVLTPVPNSPFAVRDAPTFFAMDVQARFLFAGCGLRVCMYQLNKDTGAVQEVLASPFSATTTTNPIFISEDSTGAYLYVVNGYSATLNVGNGSIDVFQIDPVNLDLVPYQNISSTHDVMSAASEPRSSTLYEFLGFNPSNIDRSASVAIYDWDSPTASLALVNNLQTGIAALTLSTDPPAQYLAADHGGLAGGGEEIDIFSILTPQSPAALSVITIPFGVTAQESFNNSGTLTYSLRGNNVVRVYDSSTGVETPHSPLPVSTAEASFSNWVLDPTGPFVYVMTTSGIVGYQLDPTTGYPSQPAQLASPFGQGIVTGPLFFSRSTSQVLAPISAFTFTPSTLTFGSITVGQSSPPQQIVLTSAGSKQMTLSSLGLSGLNAADFSETDNCAAPVVLPLKSFCTATITFSPKTANASSQAFLLVTDDSVNSPQQVPLTGTGLAPIPSITLTPSSFAFPTTTQGTTATPLTVTLTNSGTATLHITGVSLSGGNTSDYSLSTTCSGAYAISATCPITVTFSPIAPGVRATSVLISSDAGNTTVGVSGNAVLAVAIAPAPAGSTSATVSVGQTAQYNLQATPGPGFSGTITFSCSGVPFEAVCTVPANVAVSGGTVAPFSISVSTAVAAPFIPIRIPPSGPASPRSRPLFPVLFTLLAAFMVFLLFSRAKFSTRQRFVPSAAFALFLALLVWSGISCNSAGSMQTGPPQITATPSIQPAGGTITSGFPTVSITDSTPGAVIHYTTDGSMPTASSPAYSSSFTLNAAATVQAIAVASGYTTSASASANYKFQTPSGSTTITVTPTAKANGSNQPLQLSPVQLTLTVQ